eukprot:COSAG01_NODE_7485_length_3190_cov_2.884180_3_plen_78_part_00
MVLGPCSCARRHPKKGVRQIDFGMAKASNHTYLDTIASLFGECATPPPPWLAQAGLHDWLMIATLCGGVVVACDRRW